MSLGSLVLVTRPIEAGRRSAARLAGCGHRAILAPVLALEPTGTPPPPGPFDAVILTSANAVAALGDEQRTLPAFAVGSRTAAAARAAGACRVTVADGDGAALAALVAGHLAPGARLLHPTGRDRKPEPAASLRVCGFGVEVWEVYAATPASHLPAQAAEALREGRVGAVLHYSQRSAAALLDVASREGCFHALRTLRHLCLSEDVAAPLRAAAMPQVEVAPRPREDDLMALLGPA